MTAMPRDAASDLVLYGLERSVYTRVARLALEEKGLPYCLIATEIFGPEGVPADHLLRHPLGRIPVLDHAGWCLYETQAIARYVDEAFDGPALQPGEARARARMNQVIGIVDSYAYRAMVWDLFVQTLRVPVEGGTPDPSRIAHGEAMARASLSALAAIQERAPYLAGSAPTLADLHAYPTLRYLDLVPGSRRLIDVWPSLRTWLERMATRNSVQHTRSSYEPAHG